MSRRFFLVILLVCAAIGFYHGISHAAITPLTEIKDIRYFASKEYVRIVIDLVSFTKLKKGELKDSKKIYFDLEHASALSFIKKTIDVDNSLVRKIRVGQFDKDTVRVVMDLDNYEDYRIFTLANPDRVVVDIYGVRDIPPATENTEKVEKIENTETIKPEKVETTEKVEKAEPFEKENPYKPIDAAAKAKDSTELTKEPDITAKATVRPLEHPKESGIEGSHKAKEKGVQQGEALIGRKIIVIDPGHGGHDPGAMSKSGLKEKDVVLDISLQLARILREKYYFEVYMTRSEDKFISLDERTAIANAKRADMFVSVHANANNSPSLKGIETYFLNFSNSDEALRVAARENAISIKQMKEVQSDLSLILASLARESKRDESLRLAHYVQKSMIAKLGKTYRGITDHGVKQALFYVLVGASMPSALVEVSYITNHTEERLLTTEAYKEHIAEAIAAGINKYVSSLPDSNQYARAAVHKK
ncbi:MAG: N-acetylmuramoyl-L-alanine amidase [Nitrospirae bacterium]|nr:N-acetylmuramoyl-L-alanine amidase [Nitrospirota bacterium]